MRIEPVKRDQAPPVVQRIYDAIEQRDLDELGAHLSAEEAFELVVAVATAN